MPRRATTLVELIVVLAILGVLATVVSIAVRRTTPLRNVERRESIRSRIAEARREAIRSGRAISVVLDDSGTAAMATALPDGSLIADPLHSVAGTINPLTGKFELTGRR